MAQVATLTQPLQAGLQGPFKLEYEVIHDEIVENCPGAYAIGFIDNMDRFCITFVGSGGANLRERLMQRIGTASHFKFKHYVSERAAFEKECELYHQFMPSGNFLHPARPPGTDWRCAACEVARPKS